MTALCFTDSETRSLADVTKVGAYPYARHPTTEGIVWGWAFDDDPGSVWSPDWCWQGSSQKPDPMLQHAIDGGYFVAWNAFFDRWIWNAVMVPKYGWPPTRPEQWLCAQAMAEANNLPSKLDKAAECLGTHHKKDPKGKKLIELLSHGTRETWQREWETPELMGHFRSYCVSDVLSMRDVWQHIRPLTADEWAEYHASEAINDRGVAVDDEFAAAAARYAEAESAEINEGLAETTSDPDMTITAHLRKAKWLFEELWPDEELQEIVRRPERVKGKPRYSCDRSTRDAVLELIMQPEHSELFHVEHSERVIRFLELVEAGNSAAVRKYSAIASQAYQGRVRGGYCFNGAGQTGRFSDRGVQRHNMVRTPVKKGEPDRAIDAMEMILDGADPDELRTEFELPVSRLLSRLIRPTFVAAEGKTLVWADWDQIEARCLPWLSASPGGEAKLDLFRSGQDVYKYAASPIFGLPPQQIDDNQRQVGKVSELALGFGGAVGAFAAMGRGYGVVVPEGEARRIVDTWRANNSWCVSFWHELWEAAIGAWKNPGVWHHAGRVRYLFHPDLMKGTLICMLPDERWLVYPQFKHEKYLYDILDDEGEPTGRTEVRWRTSFVKGFSNGHGRIEIWYGTLAENITQAIAASFLRRALRQIEAEQPCIVLHTHDEIVAECDERDRARVGRMLEHHMTKLPQWAEGLPLTVSVEHGPYYSK